MSTPASTSPRTPTRWRSLMRPCRALSLALGLTAAAMAADPVPTVTVVSNGQTQSGVLQKRGTAATFTVTFDQDVFPALYGGVSGAGHALSGTAAFSTNDLFNAFTLTHVSADGSAATLTKTVTQTNGRTFTVAVTGLEDNDTISLAVAAGNLAGTPPVGFIGVASGGTKNAATTAAKNVQMVSPNTGTNKYYIDIDTTADMGFVARPNLAGSFTYGTNITTPVTYAGGGSTTYTGSDYLVNLTVSPAASPAFPGQAVTTTGSWNFTPSADITALGYYTVTANPEDAAGSVAAPVASLNAGAVTKTFYMWKAPTITTIEQTNGSAQVAYGAGASQTTKANHLKPELTGLAGLPKTLTGSGVVQVTVDIFDQAAPSTPVINQVVKSGAAITAGTSAAVDEAIWTLADADYNVPLVSGHTYNVTVSMRVITTNASPNAVTATYPIVITTGAPNVPVVDLDTGTGGTQTTFTSADNTPDIAISVSGAVATLATSNILVEKSTDGGTNWSTVTGTVTTGVFTPSLGSALADGAYKIRVTFTENNALTSTSVPVDLTIATPVPTLTLTSTTADHLPNYTIGGSGVTPSQSSIVVQKSTDGGTNWATIAGTVTGTDWTPNAALPDGSYKFKASWTSADAITGAYSTPTATLTIVTPTPVLAVGSNVDVASGAADGNAQYEIADLKPLIAVTGVTAGNGTLTMYRIPRTSAGLTISPYAITHASVNGVVTNNDCTAGNEVAGTFAAGVWTPTNAFTNLTAYSLVAKWTDNLLANGTDSATHTNAISVASNVFNLRVLSSVVPPVFTSVKPADGSGSNLYSGSALTLSFGAIELKGTGNAGALLSLFNGGNALPQITIPATGNWTFVFDSANYPATADGTDLDTGTNILTAQQADLCGSTSVVTPTSLDITVDAHVPNAPVISSPATGTKTADTTPTFAGTSEPLATIKLYDADNANALVGTTTADISGNWTVDLSALSSAADPGANHTITAKATTPAGITGVASAAVDVNIASPVLDVVLEPIAKGTGASYVTNGSTTVHAIGKTAVVLKTGTGTVLKGDVVRFAGDTQDYTVLAGIAAPGTITISPGLKSAKADGTAMTIQTNPKSVVNKGNGNTAACSLSSILLTATFTGAASAPVDEILSTVFTKDKVSITNGTVTSVTKGTGLVGEQPTNVWTIAITPATSGTLSASIPAGVISSTPGNIITGFSVTNGGSNYVGQPTIRITGGTAATASFVEDGDGIIEIGEITLTDSGYGFAGAPVVTVVPSPGAGASAGAVTRAAGVITAVAAGLPGSGYTVAPKVLVTGGGGSGAVITAVLGSGATAGKVVSFTVTNGGTGYTSSPTLTLTTGSGAVVAATTTAGTVIFNGASKTKLTADTLPTRTGTAYTLDVDRTRPTVTWSWAADTTTQLKPDLVTAGTAITGTSYVKLASTPSATAFKVRAAFSSVMSRALVAGDLIPTGCTVTSVTDVGGTHQNFDILLTRGASLATTMGVTVKAMPDLFDTSVPAQLNVASVPFVATTVPVPTKPIIASLVGATTPLIASRVASYPCTVTFGAPVSNFTAANLTVTNGVITKWTGSGKSYAFTLTPGEGQVTVTYDSGTNPIYDVAGTLVPTSDPLIRVLDSTQPIVEAVSSPFFNKMGSAGAGTATASGGAVTAMAVSAAGSGYAVAPVVTFTGGGGTGAAATATINAGGEITGFTITNGGTGYTSNPTVVINNAIRPLNNGVATNRFPVRVTFNEAPKAFPTAALVASLKATGVAMTLSAPTGSPGTAVGPQVVAGTANKVWAFDLVTTSAVTGSGTIKLVVPALGVSDTATNQSAASAVYTIVYDMVNGAGVEGVVSPIYSNG